LRAPPGGHWANWLPEPGWWMRQEGRRLSSKYWVDHWPGLFRSRPFPFWATMDAAGMTASRIPMSSDAD